MGTLNLITSVYTPLGDLSTGAFDWVEENTPKASLQQAWRDPSQEELVEFLSRKIPGNSRWIPLLGVIGRFNSSCARDAFSGSCRISIPMRSPAPVYARDRSSLSPRIEVRHLTDTHPAVNRRSSSMEISPVVSHMR
jgi:hypothetical protein